MCDRIINHRVACEHASRVHTHTHTPEPNMIYFPDDASAHPVCACACVFCRRHTVIFESTYGNTPAPRKQKKNTHAHINLNLRTACENCACSTDDDDCDSADVIFLYSVLAVSCRPSCPRDAAAAAADDDVSAAKRCGRDLWSVCDARKCCAVVAHSETCDSM